MTLGAIPQSNIGQPAASLQQQQCPTLIMQGHIFHYWLLPIRIPGGRLSSCPSVCGRQSSNCVLTFTFIFRSYGQHITDFTDRIIQITHAFRNASPLWLQVTFPSQDLCSSTHNRFFLCLILSLFHNTDSSFNHIADNNMTCMQQRLSSEGTLRERRGFVSLLIKSAVALVSQ